MPTTVEVTFFAMNLDKKDLILGLDLFGLGHSDPYMKVMERVPDSSEYKLLHETEFVKKNSDPEWEPFSLTIESDSSELLFEVWDLDWFSEDDFIGSFYTNLEQLTRGKDESIVFECINSEKMKDKKYINSGIVILNKIIFESNEMEKLSIPPVVYEHEVEQCYDDQDNIEPEVNYDDEDSTESVVYAHDANVSYDDEDSPENVVNTLEAEKCYDGEDSPEPADLASSTLITPKLSEGLPIKENLPKSHLQSKMDVTPSPVKQLQEKPSKCSKNLFISSQGREATPYSSRRSSEPNSTVENWMRSSFLKPSKSRYSTRRSSAPNGTLEVWMRSSFLKPSRSRFDSISVSKRAKRTFTEPPTSNASDFF